MLDHVFQELCKSSDRLVGLLSDEPLKVVFYLHYQIRDFNRRPLKLLSVDKLSHAQPTTEVFNTSLNVCQAQSLNKTLNRLSWWMFLEALIIQHSHVSNTCEILSDF